MTPNVETLNVMIPSIETLNGMIPSIETLNVMTPNIETLNAQTRSSKQRPCESAGPPEQLLCFSKVKAKPG